MPATLGEHLKKRRRELGLLQRDAAEMMGVSTDTVANWEKDKAKPVAAQFRPVLAFLGYDPTPEPQTLAERVDAKQRSLGASLAHKWLAPEGPDEVARQLRSDVSIATVGCISTP